MTIFFRLLSSIHEPEIELLKFAFYDPQSIPVEEWNRWLSKWWSRVDGKPDQVTMKLVNPKFVLRNWMAQLAIDAAEEGDYSVANELFELLKNPYDEQPEFESDWFQKRPEWARHRVGLLDAFMLQLRVPLILRTKKKNAEQPGAEAPGARQLCVY